MKLLVSLLLLISVNAFAAGHKVVLNWTASPTQTIDHYKVYRSLTPGGTRTLMGTVPANQLSFTNGSNPDNSPLIEGQRYCYVVTAVAGPQESVPSNETCATIPISPNPPSPPTGATATAQ